MRAVRRFGIVVLALTAGVLAVPIIDVLPAAASAPPPAAGCALRTATFTNSTPVPIPTGPAVVSSNIVVAGAGAYLRDADVQTFITHTFAADLDVTVRSPAGTVVTLTTDNGGSNDNVFNGTVWDDDANPAGQVPYVTDNGLATDHAYVNLTLASPLVPEEAMGAFIGENPNGTWTLTVSDDLAGDGGSIDSWGLALTGGSCPFRPDGRIKRGPAGTMVGNNTYNTTGIHQTRTGAAHAGQSVTYYLSFQNDSQVNDALRIRGRAGGGAFSIVYRHGAANITSQVVAGTFTTPSLAPQAAYSIRAVVTVHNSAPFHGSQTRKVKARSVSDTTRTDMVRFITSRN